MKFYFFLFIFNLIIIQPLFACDLTVRYEHFSPDQKSKKLQWYGMDVDLAKTLLDKTGCRYRFVDIPWGRAITLLKKGEIDMMLGVSKVSNRSQFSHFIGPYRQETIVLATLAAEAFFIEEIDELKKLDKPIAIQRGAFYGDEFETLLASDPYSDIHFVNIPSYDVKLYLLRNKRISGFFEEKSNVIFQAKHNPDFKDIVVNPFIIHSNPVYFAFSKSTVNDALIDKLRKSFYALKSEKMFETILKKYQ
ncbi:substrate-binding periplasmic protein [Pseudoalteromonas denitrificans]|uniref:Polar amino acid transport system substrate-binding protein n=1 Tax=Pseudoalteromonas denitrificans DSM 6059 TaxID=1123010 RepID=A0A1I1LFX0_9GAMM|nr:transporter substrate-binding domain-containing protein [Pseudoalteromonas denitrificans]SFC71885.1 polar amino acid transport system substrate-binding protein [Pseudoalteromonas denitrificans DSM 6059]